MTFVYTRQQRFNMSAAVITYNHETIMTRQRHAISTQSVNSTAVRNLTHHSYTCYTCTPHTTLAHLTQQMHTSHNRCTPHTTDAHLTQQLHTSHNRCTPHTTVAHHKHISDIHTVSSNIRSYISQVFLIMIINRVLMFNY